MEAPAPDRPLKVLVLAGGPDAEREVSLKSGAAVAAALRRAGHTVREADITPDEAGALDDFEPWPGDVIFPVLHGHWGEGGGLQTLLDSRKLPYVGTRPTAAGLCIDKCSTKRVLQKHGLPTPPFELLWPGQGTSLEPPVVVKPACEGSSISLTICGNAAELRQAVSEVADRYGSAMVERYTAGREITVGILAADPAEGAQALPPIEIIPAAAYYDFDAKYRRDDTQYRFDIDLPTPLLERLKTLALQAHEALGAAHLSRVDFIVDQQQQPWLLEINTLPGFTDHSLLPMAAAEAGYPMPTLVDRLARMAAGEPGER